MLKPVQRIDLNSIVWLCWFCWVSSWQPIDWDYWPSWSFHLVFAPIDDSVLKMEFVHVKILDWLMVWIYIPWDRHFLSIRWGSLFSSQVFLSIALCVHRKVGLKAYSVCLSLDDKCKFVLLVIWKDLVR